MRLAGTRRSANVQDLRGRGGGRSIGIPLTGGGLVVLLILAGVAIFAGVDPRLIAAVLGGAGTPASAPATGPAPPATDEQADFVSGVLASTEDTWPALLAPTGIAYQPPTLVLFDGAVGSACGFQSAAVGPFYCPGDRRVYLDLSFFRELESRFGAPGDFARAYVIAHEVGHHVQQQLGVQRAIDARMRGAGAAEANALSVRMELQADCFAGVWGNRAAAQGLLDPGDVEEGLRAAAAIGDDRLQRRGQGYVVPESFTHGSSAQRARWLRVGLESGDPARCDTFAASAL